MKPATPTMQTVLCPFMPFAAPFEPAVIARGAGGRRANGGRKALEVWNRGKLGCERESGGGDGSKLVAAALRGLPPSLAEAATTPGCRG